MSAVHLLPAALCLASIIATTPLAAAGVFPGCAAGEDRDADGVRDPGETDARFADTDCDAVADGARGLGRGGVDASGGGDHRFVRASSRR